MTVCIASIYNSNSILGVSDRMITAGDIKFEPPQTKIISVTNSIIIMTAGDSNIQTQIYERVSHIVGERIKLHPEKWIPVIDVAYLYRDCYLELKREATEKSVLSPYGLTMDSFISKQKELSDDFVENISLRINNFSIATAESIITGIDDDGAHIYVVINGGMGCYDRIGFASVGIGSNHALSHLMLSGHTPMTSEPKALLTIHQAKKKSEVSPGIGEQTDMFVLGPGLGTFNMLIPIPGLNIVKDLDEVYKKYVKELHKIDRKTEEKIVDYLAKLSSKNTPQQEMNPTMLSSSSSASPHEEESLAVSKETRKKKKAKKDTK